LIVSASGIRGVLNRDLFPSDLVGFARNFAEFTDSEAFLLARDTRSTGGVIRRAVLGALLSRGASVTDCGIISTPALFRESRVLNKPAIMVTASHNEPEFNGLKFIVDGSGIGADAFDRVVSWKPAAGRPFSQGVVKDLRRPSYDEALVGRFGEGSCEGVSVAMDLGGGAAIAHATTILKRLGARVLTMNDAAGVFNRRIDPIADDLLLLRKMVRENGCKIGLAFDCDGDRLAIVDNKGRKRSGDFMFTLALSRLLAETSEKKVVVSVDTTQAVEEVVGKFHGEVSRSKVGEANVVSMMRNKGAILGGEGSSGGLIDGSFNWCRDSMLAALTILCALKKDGVGVYEGVRSYHQVRLGVHVQRSRAFRAMKSLASGHEGLETIDGIKLRLSSRSWVLIRPSGTEELVRVSAEAETEERAREIAEDYAARLKELSR